ncbi:HemK2/MTQ2 family protein methyltransferase [Streptomyces yerevanensis]|uniref:HemK2/MTQ2 family protein methyltransferase n=1 Tax=Streptomyces yerevanensis TaxID=66378 RepID=UPI0009968F30|nr:HemK2/MTQ2 family protein methyltransferase [Streptomyces yerevanensis]
MFLLRPPGVYAPQGDTWLLARALRPAAMRPGARVLDIGTGTGALALAAAQSGAGPVTAVDLSPWAVLAARLNATVRRVPMRVVRGDLTRPVTGETFDVILANPPYVPAPRHPTSRGGAALAWDAGPDGRALVDRLCTAAPPCLAPGGMLLMVHSALCGVEETLARLRDTGLKAAVVDRATVPFGPVLRSRTSELRARGLIGPGQDTEELVVIRADQPRRL